MIRLYCYPTDDLANLNDLFPKSMRTLKQEVRIIRDERVTPGRCFATIDGEAVDLEHGSSPT